MELNYFIETAITGDWSACYESVKYFEKLSAQDKEKMADALIEQLNTRSERRILPILRFFRGHLSLYYLPQSSITKLVRRLQLLVKRKSSSSQVLECVAGIFHSSVPDSNRAAAAKLLLDLSYRTDEKVRSTALRNLGNLKETYDTDNLNPELFKRVLNIWSDSHEPTSVRASALHALHDFTLDLEDDKLRYTISEIVIEALESPISEFRHGALWILGGFMMGFKVHPSFTNRVFDLLLRTLKENRDIPNSWFLTAFEVTPGILPDWADARLSEMKAEEAYQAELQRKLKLEERERQTRSEYKYQVALSFAGEDRIYAQRLTKILKEKGISVFYDQYEQAELWGKDLYQHLQSVYRDKAQFCVVFLSQAYAQKLWTRHELKQAQERAFREHREYILPVRIDDTNIPGISETTGYIDLRSTSLEMIADLLLKKLSS